jgi:hypothetical protein
LIPNAGPSASFLDDCPHLFMPRIDFALHPVAFAFLSFCFVMSSVAFAAIVHTTFRSTTSPAPSPTPGADAEPMIPSRPDLNALHDDRSGSSQTRTRGPATLS